MPEPDIMLQSGSRIARFIGLLLALACTLGSSGAQDSVGFTTVHTFAPTVSGSAPHAGLVLGRDGNFYGTTFEGGKAGKGTVFQITPTGALTTLHSFTGLADGSAPESGLVEGSDGNFYGTTSSGGSKSGPGKPGYGTVFRISPTGAFTALHSFTGEADGAFPQAGLVAGIDGNLYGTTCGQSTFAKLGNGTVFRLSPKGVLTTLHTFKGGPDGAAPMAGLVQGTDGNFYGITSTGGTTGNGTVFKMDANGAATTLHSFTGGTDGSLSMFGLGLPQGGLVQGTDGNFYGVTPFGGENGRGTAFKLSATGVLTTVHAFTGGPDGATPLAGLMQGSDGSFYGTTQEGGRGNYGTAFKIDASGTLTTVFYFTNTTYAQARLVQGTDGEFYGTTPKGGANGAGAIFRLSANGVFTTLYSLTGGSGSSVLKAGLLQGSDGNLYGTTYLGGTSGAGTLFRLSANGVFTTLHSFTRGQDGGFPKAALVQDSDGNIYGTTPFGGASDEGTAFKLSPTGTLTTLHSFGGHPYAGLVRGRDGNFYGTTRFSGFGGTVFKLSPAGVLTTLYAFRGEADGGYPQAALVQGTDGDFYGTTSSRGTNAPDIEGYGTVFRISPAGALTTLHIFTGGDDGGYPQAALVQGTDGDFYGTTPPTFYEPADHGTVFKISAKGALTTLHHFTGGPDGGKPLGSLAQGTDGNFYGTTADGGVYGAGTVFKISAKGALTTLYSFTGGDDGGSPEAGLVLASDGTFYGTTSGGGSEGNGVVFGLSINPPLQIVPGSVRLGGSQFGFRITGPIGAEVVVQTCTDLASPAWVPVSTLSLVGGTAAFTAPQPAAVPRRFYRLKPQ
jgi:uncharacterized repeat protein (TIGR03803 family)